MTDIITAEKLAEIKNYEEQMFDYFSHYSAKLREWYANGGDKSEEYKIEYNKLTEEYQRYLKYIQRLRSMAIAGSDHCQQSLITTSPSYVSSVSFGISTQSLPSYFQGQLTADPTNSNTTFSASVAADYTRYYKNMINYFDNLLASVQQSDPDCGESSDDENSGQKEIMKSTAVNNCHSCTTEGITTETEETFGETPALLDTCSDPNSVMKDYFDRYVKAGEWDWASWNNYLSWIARTNPQWYEIFVNLSRGLGIDWNDMYEKWAFSVSGISKVEENPFLSHYPINQNFASANYYEVESTQVLVGSEKDIEDDNDNESDRNYCETCGRNFGTERAFTLHLRGVTHTQKTLQSTGVCAPDFTVQEESWEVKHREWLKSQYFIEPYSVVGLSGSFFCELCEVEFPSHKTLGSHLNGRRHRENVIIFESTGDRSLLKGKRKAPVKVTAKIQPFLDVCTQPLIGLNYMLEYQLQELDECLYICSLCNQWLPRKSVVKHLCSVVHRKAYLNTHYLPLFRIVDRDHSDKSLQTCRLEVYARKIEDFEGRKRLIIKEYSVKDLDLQSEIVRLIQEHNEARLMKKKEIENSPQSLCDQSISNTPVSADLEEGEIREDSSDEETTAIEEALGSPDSNSSFFTRYNVILKSIDKKRNSDTSDDTRKLNIKSQFVMGAIASGNKDVQLNGESMDETTITDDDCENYIMKLQQEGLLGLKASRSNGKMQKECTYVDHFTKEADWVLEKLKILKSKHEENLRRIAADVSAAARIKAAKLTNIENSTLHQYAIIHNSSFNHFVDELRYENSNLMLPSLGAPVGPSTPTRVNYNYPPPNIGNSNELRGNSGENNSRITLSSSAFNVILSAIDALKSSGHLPSGLNQSVKENNTMNTHINTSNQPVNTVDNRQLPFSSLNQVSRKPEQRMPEVSASTTSSITTMQYPNPPPTDVPRSTPVPVPSDREPVDSRAYSPQRAYRCTQNQAVTTSAYNWHMQNNPAFKPLIGAYEQQNEMHQSGSNGFKNDEKIFDAYTIFSKRSERKRAQKQSWIKTPKYFRRDLKNEANHGPTNTTQLNNMTGKRLSAIADFLGVNEPPTERKRIPSSNQLEKCSATTLPYPSYSSNNTQHQSALGHLPSFPESIRSPTMYTNQFSHRNTPLPYNNFMNVSGPSPSYAATSNSYPPTNLFTTPTHGSLWPIHVNSNFSASNAPQTLRLPQCSSSFFPR